MLSDWEVRLKRHLCIATVTTSCKRVEFAGRVFVVGHALASKNGGTSSMSRTVQKKRPRVKRTTKFPRADARWRRVVRAGVASRFPLF